MKVFIVHIGNYLLDGNSGVAQKTFAQASEMRSLGVVVETVAFVHHKKGELNHTQPLTIIHCASADPFPTLHEFLDVNVKSTDAVLFRYPFASPGLLQLVAKFGRQIIFEHNTIEQEEMLLTQRKHFKKLPFSLSPSYFSYFLRSYVLKQTWESKFGSEILKSVIGGISVTHEIASYERSRAKGYNTICIANGAPKLNDAIYPAPEFHNRLKVVMVLGNKHVWHGIDRLIEGLKRYRNAEVFIELDFIGFTGEEVPVVSSTDYYKISALGRYNPAQLEAAMQQYHLAVGSLALHKINLSEASPLKVRQCLMAGVPMVLGYTDTDVSNSKTLSRYALNVPADDSPLNWEEIVIFYQGLNTINDLRMKVAAAADEELSMRVKSAQYVKFIQSLMTGNAQ